MVGLSTATASAMPLAMLNAYDSGWRTPTQAQNIAFVGSGDNYTPSGGFAQSSVTDPQIGIGAFPNSGGEQLPAAYILVGNISYAYRGTVGYWPSRTIKTQTDLFNIYFNSTQVRLDRNVSMEYGFPVRCVPK